MSTKTLADALGTVRRKPLTRTRASHLTAHRQTWALSQEANKASGICSSCHAVRQIHLKNGTIHQHGPRKSRCPGSNKQPLDSIPPASSSQPATSKPYSLVSVATTSDDSAISTNTIANSQSIVPNLLSFCEHPVITGGLIKHIPKSARPTCATFMSRLLNTVNANIDNLEAWTSILNFGKNILRKPARTGRRHNLANIIKKRTDIDTSESVDDLPARLESRSKKRDTAATLAATVKAKVEDGNIKAAIRILCSEDKPATDNEATYTKLLERHPVPPPGRGPAPDPHNINAIQVTEEVVLKAIQTFPAGSSGGPDGIRPQHILDLVNCRESGPALVKSITAFVNCLLDGKCNPAVMPILFGGQLIALEKKTGGVRPIAVGYTLRRIAAKCANMYSTAILADYLQPIQLGVGISGGCEAAVHATRRFMESMPADHCVVKLDFTNAFNCLRRDSMLEAVLQRTPGIYKFCHLAYSQPSVLSYNGRSILSSEGTQQGDPLSASLFCSTIHPLLSVMKSDLVLGYMDDVTLGGSVAQVAMDVATIRRKGEEIGLQLNDMKCECISCSGSTTEPAFKHFLQMDPQNATLLGAPLITGKAMDSTLDKRCNDLSRAISRMNSITAHDALVLLRASFSAPKLLHTLRSSPTAGHPALEAFDDKLRSGICSITNTDLTDNQWLQASLPVRNGGLGIRRVSSLAPSAFLASAASTRELQEKILRSCQTSADMDVDRVLTLWMDRHNCAAVQDATNQRAWDKPCIDAEFFRLLSSQPEMHHKARLLALTAPHSGDWLHALPISACGLRLEDEDVRVAVGLRLGATLCEPHQCPCGAIVDPRGIHGLACKRSVGRVVRHHIINDLIWRALNKASVPSIKEPAGLLRSDGKRPDGLTLIPWQNGRCMTWDVTVTDTLADSYLAVTSITPGAAAEGAASRKELKYQELAVSHSFIPLAFETLGPINYKAMSFISGLGQRLSTLSGNPRESSFLFQRLSIAIQRFNSIAFRGTFQTNDNDS